jgi:hypothetical protein
MMLRLNPKINSIAKIAVLIDLIPNCLIFHVFFKPDIAMILTNGMIINKNRDPHCLPP